MCGARIKDATHELHPSAATSSCARTSRVHDGARRVPITGVAAIQVSAGAHRYQRCGSLGGRCWRVPFHSACSVAREIFYAAAGGATDNASAFSAARTNTKRARAAINVGAATH